MPQQRRPVLIQWNYMAFHHSNEMQIYSHPISQSKFYHRLIVYQFRRSKRESKENLRSKSFFFTMRSSMIVNFYLRGCIGFTPFYLFPFSVRSFAYCVGAALGSFIMIDMVDPGWKVAKFSEELLE